VCCKRRLAAFEVSRKLARDALSDVSLFLSFPCDDVSAVVSTVPGIVLCTGTFHSFFAIQRRILTSATHQNSTRAGLWQNQAKQQTANSNDHMIASSDPAGSKT